MASELDNLPDEETPVHGRYAGMNDYVKMYRDMLDKTNDEGRALAAEFRTSGGLNIKHVEWLKAYLDHDSLTCNKPWASARVAGVKQSSVPTLMKRYEPLIRKWFNELRYGELQVKQVVAKWFDAKEAPKIQTVKGKINPASLPAGTKVLTETDDETTLITEMEHAGQLKAAELASKHLGLLSNDKVDLGTIKIEVVNYSDRPKDDTDSL